MNLTHYRSWNTQLPHSQHQGAWRTTVVEAPYHPIHNIRGLGALL